MKFLHTSDWQIGMKADSVGRMAERVREERLEAARRVVQAALDNGAEMILLTGDVFDTFEYFVHAYGLMVSMSSLSYAGWLLNGGVKFALIPRHLQASENTQWLKPEFGWFTAL